VVDPYAVSGGSVWEFCYLVSLLLVSASVWLTLLRSPVVSPSIADLWAISYPGAACSTLRCLLLLNGAALGVRCKQYLLLRRRLLKF
jgi:hypothetical protein